MESIPEKVTRFFSHYERHLDALSSGLPSPSESLYSRILLTALLDSWSAVACPESGVPHRNVGKRYVEFVIRFSGWPDSERVSLLHLARALSRDNHPAFAQIRNWAKSELQRQLPTDHTPKLISHPSETERGLSVDPSTAEVMQRWPRDHGSPLKIGDIAPHSLRHAALLYQYRNHLVHEFRVPGSGWDVTGRGEPHYQRFVEADGLRPLCHRWELVYPLEFLVDLCKQSLLSLTDWLRRENRNPFESTPHASYWLTSLN